MHWTDDDTTDVGAAAAALRALAERLETDARNRRPGGRTREALDACIARLLELDDVYFEAPDGRRIAEVWDRARLTVRPKR